MRFSQSLNLDEILSKDKISELNSLLSSYNSNSIIILSDLAKNLNINNKTTYIVLSKLCDSKILVKYYAVKCPNCGIFIDKYNSMDEIYQDIYCYSCEQEFAVSESDIFVIYKLTSL